jgi:UDP-glucose 4,6-dehydratase
MNIMITGAAGFVGSHVTQHFFNAYPDARLRLVDKMTYAADFRNIDHLIRESRVDFQVGDLCDFDFMRSATHNQDVVLHLAAESHVDNSFGNSTLFTRTNTLGTHNLIEASTLNKVKKIVHVSTDEVYGENIINDPHDEESSLNPTNPYSASKAAAEMIIMGYLKSYKAPITIVRANNMYGKFQYPEKLIPRTILRLLRGKKAILHGTGQYQRAYLSAEDFAVALQKLVDHQTDGEIFNIGSESEYSNEQVVRKICNVLGLSADAHIQYTQDRPFNDSRYFINYEKIKSLGWIQTRYLDKELTSLVGWYRQNSGRYTHLEEL